MGEFVSGDDWDLEAVVRGYMSQASDTTLDIMEWFDSFIDDPMMRSSVEDNTQFPVDFPGSLEMATALDDFEGLYDTVMLPASLQDTAIGSTGNTMETNSAGKLQEGAGSAAVAAPVDIDGVHAATAKYKRRKSQNKHVVQHVTADSISSDLWAWRKYGQKPIKGSPYPRSYYRCSSSKGCSARKQVERSSSEPGMFIVTYTGEHSHSQPTRRSALAGISRPSKFSAPKKPSTAGGGGRTNGETKHVPKLPQEITTTDNNGHESPPASTATMEDGPCKQERLVWGVSESDDKIVDLPSLGLGEEIFLGFDELEGLGMDFALNGC